MVSRKEGKMVSTSAWSFLASKDKKKIVKAGFATPRGGAKNAYQNHVLRSNRVIIPWERLDDLDLSAYRQGFVIRILPEQCFERPGKLTGELGRRGVKVGANAFVLYRTHKSLEEFPPIKGWKPRGLTKDGVAVTKRGARVVDTGEYVIRLSNPKLEQGPPQGIFAPEYADVEDNRLSQAVLAWILCRSLDAPYKKASVERLERQIAGRDSKLLAAERLEREYILRDGVASCPLCQRKIRYSEFHQILDLSEATGLANAGLQVEGATRSTIVNLFHLGPLLYGKELNHRPDRVAWGHAVCNTLLGQRRCIPLNELTETGQALDLESDESFGWISKDENMIRSKDGGVWVRLVARGHASEPLIDDVTAPELLEDEDA
jgi:hypothetical protein